MYDILIIGAGPAGLAVAREAVAKGFKTGVVERGCIANSFYHYPLHLRFHSTADQLSVGGFPFIAEDLRPTRREALRYFQQVARRLGCELTLWTGAQEILGTDNAFLVKCRDRFERDVQLRGKKIVVATGSYGLPRMLHVPGEGLPKVSHYYAEPYGYEGMQVVVVGGGDSAAEAALELAAHNVRVTLSYRKQEFTRLKPWTKAELEKAIADRRVAFHGGSLVKEIREDSVVLWIKERGEQVLENDFALLLTGYAPDLELVRRAGVHVGDGDGQPAYFRENCETNVSGVYLAGIVQAGSGDEDVPVDRANVHAEAIIRDILSKM